MSVTAVDQVTNGVFAYVELKPCGCWAEVFAPELLPDYLRKKRAREALAAGKVVATKSREEWESIPYECDACRKKGKK